MRSGMDARCMNSVISVGVMGLVMTLAGVDGWCPAAVAAAADTPAEQSVTTAPAQPPAVPCINGYAAATAAAQQAGAMLLVSVEPEVSDTDLVGSYLQQSDLQARFMASPTPWVFCRLPIDGLTAVDGEPIRLIDHPSLAELRQGPGLFAVDYAHPTATEGNKPVYGRIVSVLPRKPGKYYRFATSHIDELADMPAGTLTQRSMILAVRIHPENPRSTEGEADPVLASEAASHSEHQASLGNQGHHNWSTRSRRILSAVSHSVSSPVEVVAESWENQDLLDSCVDCVSSWRQSSGHWNAVRSRHKIFGFDIRRGLNGIWYATGIFAR
jgi:hypothetical protein